ncbi:MAG: PilZ domain-containing protein [Spirochaetes bacterium]|nr:PilZ domain-containing protein [Spirochaetota bacterium]
MLGVSNEKRKYTRLPIEIKAEVQLEDGKILPGITKNISFSGILAKIEKAEEIREGDLVNLTIFLLDGQKDPAIEFECKVIRRDKADVGFKYIAIIDVESYTHFKNLMVSNSREPELLISELKQTPGIIVDHDF